MGLTLLAALDGDRFELPRLARGNAIAVGFDHGVQRVGAEGKRVNYGWRRVGRCAVEGPDIYVTVKGARGESPAEIVVPRSRPCHPRCGFAGLRILIGPRTGSSYTSDLSPDGLRQMVKAAIELAEITTDDPHAGLPDPADLGQLAGDLQLYDPAIEQLSTADKIDYARRAEIAALDADPRIFNSEGASFDSNLGRHIFANSRGFLGEYRTSYCGLSAVPVAKEGDSMERDYWYSAARSFAKLELRELVASRAGWHQPAADAILISDVRLGGSQPRYQWREAA